MSPNLKGIVHEFFSDGLRGVTYSRLEQMGGIEEVSQDHLFFSYSQGPSRFPRTNVVNGESHERFPEYITHAQVNDT